MSLPTDKQARKERPIARGVLAYFPDAIAEVARVSFIGNEQHNPGQPLHWSRGKSTDHADCAARHLIEAGTIDEDGLPHTAKLAWRALAMLQLEMEERLTWKDDLSTLEARVNEALVEDQVVSTGTPICCISHVDLAKGESSEAVSVVGSSPEAKHLNEYLEERYPAPRTYNADDFSRQDIVRVLRGYGCCPVVAEHIANGTTFGTDEDRYVYLAGPMRGLPDHNFPAFDEARDLLLQDGWTVISPADIDRSAGFSENQLDYVYRDFFALYFIAKQGNGAVAMLPDSGKSTGAPAELFLSRWMQLAVLNGLNGRLAFGMTADTQRDLIAGMNAYLAGQA